MKSNILAIAKIVYTYYGIKFYDLIKKTNKRETVVKRQIAHYFCKKYKVASDSMTGSVIGGKDHATVISSHKRINELLETKYDKSLVKDIEFLDTQVKRLLDKSSETNKKIRYNKARNLVACRSASRRHKISYKVEFITNV